MDFLGTFPAVSGMSIGDRIKDSRKKAGISQAELARLVGRSQSAVAEWETGGTEPRRNIVEKIAAVLDVSPLWLEVGGVVEAGRLYEPYSGEEGGFVEGGQTLNDPGPVYATMAGGDGEQVVTSDIVEYRPKPSKWSNVKGLYGFYVISDSMEPRINAGELVWVHPNRRPAPGQEAVFTRRGSNANASHAVLKVYVGQTPAFWIVKQYNPEKEDELSKAEWDCQLIVDLDLNR